VIVNITGAATSSTAPVRFSNNIVLSGGIISDQVFFTILGTNTGALGRRVLTATASGKTLNGVF
jgi:hypothetical protein